MSGRYVEVEPGSLRIREEEPRPLPAGWGRVRVLACGVCGTDLHLFHGMDLPRGKSYPVRPGHEVAGTVLEGELGEIRVGTSVVLHPLLPCGTCSACRAGFENRCRTAHALGIDDPGGLADEVLWPLTRMVPAAGLAPVEAAVLADAVATAHHALELAAVPPGGALTVLGAGGVGTHILQLARLRDPVARLTAVVRSGSTAERLRRLQLDVDLVEGLAGCGRRILEARGPQDAVIEFGAGPEAAPEGPPMLARGGRLIFGSISPAALELETTLTALVTRELQVIGSYTSTLADLAAVAGLAAAGCLDLSASVSHVVPLAEATRAFQLLETRPAGLSRVVVTP
jgi:D-arabinose 1-dehydrogenase-like Zn-dependent alcohol dehydrogenase